MSIEREKETRPEGRSPETTGPPVSAARSRMKRALVALGIVLIIKALFFVWVEWMAAHGFVGDPYDFVLASFLWFLLIGGIVAFVRMLKKRAFAAVT
jgi:hypothetical protein